MKRKGWQQLLKQTDLFEQSQAAMVSLPTDSAAKLSPSPKFNHLGFSELSCGWWLTRKLFLEQGRCSPTAGAWEHYTCWLIHQGRPPPTLGRDLHHHSSDSGKSGKSKASSVRSSSSSNGLPTTGADATLHLLTHPVQCIGGLKLFGTNQVADLHHSWYPTHDSQKSERNTWLYAPVPFSTHARFNLSKKAMNYMGHLGTWVRSKKVEEMDELC